MSAGPRTVGAPLWRQLQRSDRDVASRAAAVET